jgi:hypothetical protein
MAAAASATTLFPNVPEQPAAAQNAEPAAGESSDTTTSGPPRRRRSSFSQMQWDEASGQHELLEEVEERALSSELSKALAAVYKRGGSASGIAWPRAIAWTLVGALVVPVLTTTPYFLIPLADAFEQPTFASQWRWHLVVLPLSAIFMGPCIAIFLLAYLNVPATPRLVFGFACVIALVYPPIEWAASQLWAFPVPMGFIWISVLSSTAAILWLVHEVHGLRRVVRDRALLKGVSCQLGVMVLAQAFLVAFTFYRGIFASLDGNQQAAIAPLFTMMKLGFKDVAIRLISIGGNPDAAPLAAFVFDIFCGTTANFLVYPRRAFDAGRSRLLRRSLSQRSSPRVDSSSTSQTSERWSPSSELTWSRIWR